jgi:hypothetical protein
VRRRSHADTGHASAIYNTLRQSSIAMASSTMIGRRPESDLGTT